MAVERRWWVAVIRQAILLEFPAGLQYRCPFPALKYKILRIDLVLAESYMCLVEYVGHYLSFNVFVPAGCLIQDEGYSSFRN